MPVNVVKTPADEKHWKEAKAQAAEQGRAGSWKYVMGIFQRMKHHLGGTKGKHPWRNEELDVDAVLDAITEGEDLEAIVTEVTHWPAVPTYYVRSKAKHQLSVAPTHIECKGCLGTINPGERVSAPPAPTRNREYYHPECAKRSHDDESTFERLTAKVPPLMHRRRRPVA